MRTIHEIHDTYVMSTDEINVLLRRVGWSAIIDAVAETFVEEALGKVVSPAKTVISFEDANNDFRVMPSYMEKYPDYCGVKIVGACTDNPKKFGLPLAMATYILNDKWTQRPLLMFDAGVTTAWRTAAATAVSVRELSDPCAATLGIIGCGVQSQYHIDAIKAVRDIKKILVLDLDETKMNALVEDGDGMVVASSKEEIFQQADIVVTMTPTTKPHMFAKDIPHRSMLICAVGGDSEKKIEFDSDVLQVVDPFCDSIDQVSHTGTVYKAISQNQIELSDLKPLGNLMVGPKAGELVVDTPFNPLRPVKMFLSTGVALEDLAMARLLLESIR